MGIIRGSHGYLAKNNRGSIDGQGGIKKESQGYCRGLKGVPKNHHRDFKRDTWVSYGDQIGNIGGPQGYHRGIKGLTLRDPRVITKFMGIIK